MSEHPLRTDETAPAHVRPLTWSVRRELWENRSIFLAPAAVALFVQFGFLISAIGMPNRRRAVLLLDPIQQRVKIGEPYDFAAVALMFTALIVAFFYCLEALHGERRDRSILFWKSLPVSDRTAVLSKACIPLIVLPAITFATVVITQFTILLLTSAVLWRSGLAATTWTRFNLLWEALVLAYGFSAITLWFAPVYGWLLMISAWARRAAFLWAILPVIAISVLERIAFGRSYVGRLLQRRMTDFAAAAFDFRGQKTPVIDSLSQLTLGRYLTTPGLWFGLLFAALFLAAAVRLRRNREPI